MATEIFRFMTIRPPQEVDPIAAADNTVDLNHFTTKFIASLVRQTRAESRAGIDKIVQGYRKSNGDEFIDSRKKVDPRLLSFYESLFRLDEKGFPHKAIDSFIRIFDLDPKLYVTSSQFRDFFGLVTNSIVIAAIEPSIEPKVRSLLVNLAKTLGLVQKLANFEEGDVYSKADFRSQIIVLPEGIFPLPTTKQDTSKIQKAERRRLAKIASNQAKLLELSKQLTTNRNAINDLLTTFEKSIVQHRQPRQNGNPPSSSSNGARARRGFTLPDKAVSSLGNETKATLKKMGLDLSNIDVAMATSLIGKQSSEISNKLYASRSSMRYMVSIGNNLIPSDVLIGDMPTELENPGTEPGVPGVCPPVSSGDAGDEVTVPLNETHGDARVLGVADLMIVEQELLGYKLGEIAHIENVLQSEFRERSFRVTNTVERTTLTETEVTDEKTKDLTSTERFELQTESEKVINDNSSTEAGITVNASYGPSVDATSNFNHINSNAKQESMRASASFARETTLRATSKIQKRTLERQFVRTVNETEEINKHGFDNKLGTDNISGVYRFVDKIYQAQIINYGKRLMLEFIVPEPAAFLRYALAKQPNESINAVKPDPPGYCQNNNFIPLQPQHIDRDKYLFWASKYGAEDIEPPPAATLVISDKKNKDAIPVGIDEAKLKYNSEHFEIPIEDGYVPLAANVNIYGETQEGTHRVVVQVQDEQLFYIEPFHDRVPPLPLLPSTTGKVPVTINSIGFHNYEVVVSVQCICSKEKWEAWQIKTFNSIMNAYNDQKSRYDNAIETARIRAGDYEIGGTNPAMNRECEKTELKKGCISLLTAQSFETFDSVKRNAAPHGYPEIAFADAKAEGRYIQFFENAFEWGNMTYIFYPYFWGKKDDWVTISQLIDNDPLYTCFLKAGAARVQVPVRPGFETSMLHYLEVGTIWFGEGVLVNAGDGIADPLHLSVLDELKEQLGNQSIEGKGRLRVTKDATKVTGDETAFSEDDENKRIIIRGRTYLIKKRVSLNEIELTEKYLGATENDVRYALDAKLVGEPWEVKVPTDLVMIDPRDTLEEINAAIRNG